MSCPSCQVPLGDKGTCQNHQCLNYGMIVGPELPPARPRFDRPARPPAHIPLVEVK